ILRQHALDGGLDDALRVALQRLAEGFALEIADVPGEAVVQLVGPLVAGDVDLLGVYHDDVVAGVDVRGVDRPVIAAPAVREVGAEASEGLDGGDYDETRE